MLITLGKIFSKLKLRSKDNLNDQNLKMAPRSFLFTLVGLLSLLTSTLAGTTAEGLAFLSKKAKEDGVVTTSSGLMYKELRAGESFNRL